MAGDRVARIVTHEHPIAAQTGLAYPGLGACFSSKKRLTFPDTDRRSEAKRITHSTVAPPLSRNSPKSSVT